MKLFIFKLFLILTIPVLLACSSLKINKISINDSIKTNSFIYQLPQNEIQLVFHLQKTTFIPGPFANYAEDFLEIKPLKSSDEVDWNIEKIDVQSYAIVDTNQIYSLTGALNKILPENMSQLMSLQNYSKPTLTVESYSKLPLIIPEFSEIGLKKILIENSETSYKTITIDSVAKKIPIVNKVIRNKTTEELAKDAAKTLTKIRKRKFRLIAGLNEKLPKAESLKMMLEALDQKEQEYLELFFGKTSKEVYLYQVSVKPLELKKYLLFYFDKKEGVIENKTKGMPVWFNLEPSANINNSKLKFTKSEKYLPYKTNVIVPFSIIENNTTLLQSKVELAQFGTIQYLPLELLKTSKLNYNPHTGSIISIEK